MYNTTNNGNPSAWIVNGNDKGRKKIYANNKVYLDDNQEFQIELVNPLTETVLAKININGKPACATGLILRPGQRFYLDCFIDDRKKFVFKTYQVENTTESLNAIANNGFVEVSFFKEKQSSPIYIGNTITTWTSPINPNWNCYYTNSISSLDDSNIIGNTITNWATPINPNWNCYYTNSINSLDGSNITVSNTSTFEISSTQLNNTSLNLNQKIRSKSLTTETGRIEKGDKSKQKFESLDMDFENYTVSKVSYQLLPNSKKPVETSEIKKNFCSACGYKLKGTEKFCPSCGTRI